MTKDRWTDGRAINEEMGRQKVNRRDRPWTDSRVLRRGAGEKSERGDGALGAPAARTVVGGSVSSEVLDRGKRRIKVA